MVDLCVAPGRGLGTVPGMAKRNPFLPETPCDRCGEVHERCKGHAKSTGHACKVWPSVEGSMVCKWHGQDAPQTLAKSEERAVEYRLSKLLSANWTAAEGVSATEAYEKALAITAGNLNSLTAVLEEAEQNPEENGGNLASWVEWTQKIASEAAKVADAGVKSGIAGRALAVTEAQQRMVGEALLYALKHVGLDEHIPAVLAAMREHITTQGVE